MSKINKIITNKPVTLTQEEVANLSETLSAVRTAGGGGGGGATYGGDGRYIEITGNNTITLTTTAANQLDRVIPTKVSDLEDASDYATVESLTAYQEVGNYLSANALNSLSGTWETVTAKLDKTEFAEVSGNFLTEASLNGYATEQYVQAASAEVTGWVNSQNYLTEVPDTYYLKTETSGKDEISAAFSNIPAYILTGDSNITATSAQDGKNIKWNLSINAHPTVTDTTLTGERGIYTHTTDVSGQWCVELVQSAYDAINNVANKLDSSDFTTYTGTTAPNTYLTKTSADTLYQPTGDYVTTADVLTGTNNTLTGIKIGSTKYTIPTTDLSNYYTKTQVDSTFASATQLNDYLTTAKYQTDSATFALKTQLDDYAPISITATVNTLTAASAGWNDKVDKPTELVNQYLVLRTDSEGNVSGWTDFNANVYSKSESDGRYQKKADMSSYLTTAQYQTDSATFVTSSSNTISGTKQYALTTAGWTEVQGGGLSGVSANAPLSGDGTSTNPLGFDMTSAYTIDGTNGITAVPNTATNKIVVQMTDDVYQDVQILHSSISKWNEVSGLSAKSTVSANTTNNVIAISANNTATPVNISATTYYTNTGDANFAAQRLFVVHNDEDLVRHVTAGLCQGQGSLFFVMSGFQN